MPIQKSEYINPQDYPILHAILWDRRHLARMTGEEALGMYELRWDYVDETRMPEYEKLFLKELIQTVGNGKFHV